MVLAGSHAQQPAADKPLEVGLRDYPRTNDNIVAHIIGPVAMAHDPPFIAQSERLIALETPSFRLTDILVTHRPYQAGALGTPR